MYPKTSPPASLCEALLSSENRRLSSGGRFPYWTSSMREQDRQPPTLLEILNAVESILAEGRHREETDDAACARCKTQEENQENNETEEREGQRNDRCPTN
ncbi:hypothetical protein IV203_018496 [Nitzschia inconspicua]|uniref:Uncharacterized protein n=1 Tax=Nitzschia inconspicua TaxID=303405 RepID=A0A9K3M159_9STRA|nr:hypothetical protein IV203_018496 [Nitzschia inconspicua]